MRLPNRLNGDSPVANSVNQIIDYLRSLTPRNSATSRVTHTHNGVIHEPIIPPIKAGGGQFRGEYSATVSYSPQQTVVISTGSNAGTYICVAASTGNNPWAGGGYWVQISGIPANIYL
jgi:hypothetical protein